MSDNSVRLALSAEDLLAGTTATYDVAVPASILRPGGSAGENHSEAVVRLRPLTLGVFLLIMKAAKEDASLIPLLMIQESLVEPEMSLNQIKQLHLGLINFLIGHIRQISGLGEKKSP